MFVGLIVVVVAKRQIKTVPIDQQGHLGWM